MALGAMTVVAVSILTATTLLPALIAMLGDRVDAGRHRRPGRALLQAPRLPPPVAEPAQSPAPAPAASGSAGRARVMAPARGPRSIGVSRGPADPRHPGALDGDRHRGARPVPRRTATSGSATNSPPSSSAAAPTRSRSSPPSTAAPTPPTAPPSPASPRELEATPGVSSVAPPAYAGDSVLIQATPSAPSESDAALALVDRLRDDGRPGHRAGRGRRRSTSAAKPPAATTSATRSAARCGRSSSSSSRSASSS